MCYSFFIAFVFDAGCFASLEYCMHLCVHVYTCVKQFYEDHPKRELLFRATVKAVAVSLYATLLRPQPIYGYIVLRM